MVRLSQRLLQFGLPALALAGLVAAPASAQFATSNDGPVVEAFGTQNFVLDDGTAENALGLTAGGQFIWANRFTPPANHYPLRMLSVDVLFRAQDGCTVGNAMDIYVYSDADGNPANGATHVGSITGGAIQILDDFSTFTFATPIDIAGPGDVLVAVVNRGCNAAGQFPAAIDQTASQGRSWIGFGGTLGNPPTLPPSTWGEVGSFGFPGNWLIRASYLDAIPVEMTRFEAMANGRDAVLSWGTASETNNAGFEVQVRAPGAEGYTVLGFVEGHGTTTEAQAYSYRAEGLTPGTYAFRLRQVDFDGQYAYHGDVEVDVETPGTHLLTEAYPNPFNPQATFTLSVAQRQQVTVELFNALGQRVGALFNGTLDANASQALTIDGAGLPSGAYVVRVTGETFADALRVALVK